MVPFVSDVLKRDLKRWVSGDNVCLSTKKNFSNKNKQGNVSRKTLNVQIYVSSKLLSTYKTVAD